MHRVEMHVEHKQGRSDETQAKSVERQVAVVRAKYEALAEHAGAGVAVYQAVDEGRDFTVVDFNRTAEEIEHVSRLDVIGKSILEAFPGVREFGLFDVLQQVWRTGEPQSHPVSVYRDQRISGWRQNYVCKLPNGHVMAVYSDVTQSKRNELAAKMSEQRFRAIANYTYDWEVWVGPTGRVLWTNPAATRVSGYEIEELLRMSNYPAPLAYEPDREKISRAFYSAVEGSTGSEQFRIETKDGRVVWAEMSWLPIYDEAGNPLGHRESIRDVTARKLAEHAAELAEHEKEEILDNMAEQVIHMDADQSILWANRAACKAVGMEREQMIGCLSDDVRPQWCDSSQTCPAVQAMEAGQRIELQKSSPDGRTWLIQAAPVRDQRGGIIGGVEIALDVTSYRDS